MLRCGATPLIVLSIWFILWTNSMSLPDFNEDIKSWIYLIRESSISYWSSSSIFNLLNAIVRSFIANNALIIPCFTSCRDLRKKAELWVKPLRSRGLTLMVNSLGFYQWPAKSISTFCFPYPMIGKITISINNWSLLLMYALQWSISPRSSSLRSRY